jgi:dienelactone hydrolase/tRNA A-37 threonylcarbamoyl transferase component Bud32
VAEARDARSATAGTQYDRLRAAIGDRYRVEHQIGEGGMATVFLAEDLKHHRKVAIKVLHETLTHTIGIQRFLQEIDVIAGMQHPHLLTLIDSGDVDGLPYYVMPYVEGQSLRELLTTERRLPIERAVAITCEIADGLDFAHKHGVIHRDIKPSNILMSGGHAMVADFGIATALEKAAVGRLTETGISLGSPTYMSPEQASAERDLDARTDVYSLACVLYEMICGEPPIDDPSMQKSVTRKLTGGFAPVRKLRPDAPVALEAAMHKALATNREERFATIREFSDATVHALGVLATKTPRRVRMLRWGIALAAVAVFAVWFQHQRRVLWAAQRIGEIERLATGAQYASAFDLAEKVGDVLPRDSTLQRLRPKFADFITIVSVPAGARVHRQRLDRPASEWELLGTTPLDSIAVPKYGLDLSYRIRIERDGFKTAEFLPNVFARWIGGIPLDTVRLDPVASGEEGMVRIPGWTMLDSLHSGRDSIRLADYRIGRNEVTNREFRQFVAAGGYEKKEYWTEPFVRDGRTIPREQAMAAFRDRSGLPGPSTWSGGTYPNGQDDFPVGGVSWYEAAAYARFAGKRLPTSAHWARAALNYSRQASWIYVPASNLSTAGPRRVGQGAINPYGLYDVVGNVREWCANAMEGGYVTRGGGWDDADFLIGRLIPKPDFDRSPSNGFRLVKLSDHDTTLAHLSGPVARVVLVDYSRTKPISEAEFRIFKRLFDYDAPPLNTRLDTSAVRQHYRWEKVSFTAAYGGERMSAYVFLPKDAKPPYPAVLFWPGSGVVQERSYSRVEEYYENFFGFIPHSRRALVMPVFKGMFERDDSAFSLTYPNRFDTPYARDLVVQWLKDLRRTVDYLESRSDIAIGQLGFFGYSWGGRYAPMAMSLEPRLRVAVLNVGGLATDRPSLPETDPASYLARTRAPTLMLNGRYDVVFPYETGQLPFFRMLGTPPADKKHIVYPSSHSVPQEDVVRETLAWFDKYLGPAPQK